jgi:hypothetical protein
LGQLSGDGQLRELMKERRSHGGGDAELWYLPPFLLVSLGLGSRDQEGIAALDPGVITWLQLRFGGVVRAAATVDQASLKAKAATLPAPAPLPPSAPAALAPAADGPRQHRHGANRWPAGGPTPAGPSGDPVRAGTRDPASSQIPDPL